LSILTLIFCGFSITGSSYSLSSSFCIYSSIQFLSSSSYSLWELEFYFLVFFVFFFCFYYSRSSSSWSRAILSISSRIFFCISYLLRFSSFCCLSYYSSSFIFSSLRFLSSSYNFCYSSSICLRFFFWTFNNFYRSFFNYSASLASISSSLTYSFITCFMSLFSYLRTGFELLGLYSIIGRALTFCYFSWSSALAYISSLTFLLYSSILSWSKSSRPIILRPSSRLFYLSSLCFYLSSLISALFNYSFTSSSFFLKSTLSTPFSFCLITSS
jgi:hypothetical protein